MFFSNDMLHIMPGLHPRLPTLLSRRVASGRVGSGRVVSGDVNWGRTCPTAEPRKLFWSVAELSFK